MTICPERTRLKQVLPQFNTGTDATAMGTAVHWGIETILGGKSLKEGHEAAQTMFAALKYEGFKETNLNPDMYEVNIDSMLDAFYGGILPEVELGGSVEYRFSVPMHMTVDGYEVWLEGTMDYITPSGVIWDWKTANRAYNGKDKQSTSIQASAYVLAANTLGLCELPAEFRYGVMIRQPDPKAQIVYLSRNDHHILWLKSVVEPIVRYALDTGFGNPWMRNDTSTLCSDKWCSHWTVCKGATVSWDDLSLPAVPVTINPKVDTEVREEIK
jgi:hypothetical protein